MLKSNPSQVILYSVYPVYSKSGRRYIVKISPGGGLEASLLLQVYSFQSQSTRKKTAFMIKINFRMS